MSDYSDFVTNLALACAYAEDDTEFVAEVPAAIQYCEGRIYADPMFDFLSTRAAPTAVTVSGSRNITKPSSLIIVEAVNVITPSGYSPDANGSTRVPLERVTLAYMDMVWGVASGSSATGTPVCYAPLTDTAWRFGPVPDAVYTTEWIGPTQPAALSASNTSTFITANMPELFLAGAMVFMTGSLLKNFGSQADNPAQAQSWENQFNLLKTGRTVQEARRKALGAMGTAYPPAPLLQAARG